MRWPRRAVGGEAGERRVLLHQARVGVEDVGHLAVQAHADVLGQARVPGADERGRAHDELEVGEVVVVLGPDHQEAALLLIARRAVQAVAAVEHEDLERRHAVRRRQRLHLVDVAGGDRRQVIAVVAVVTALRQLQDLGKELRVAAAAVQVVLARAEVGEHRRHAARHRRAALVHRVLGERPVDADVRVRVHHARKREPAAPVVDAARLGGGDLRRHARDAAVPDADIPALDLGPGRPHHAHVLDQEVQRGLGHQAWNRTIGAARCQGARDDPPR